MGWGEYARSKMPLKLVFILIAAIAVNLMIIEGFTLLFSYDHSGPMDEAALIGMNSSYQNCTILDSYQEDSESNPPWYNHYTAYLLQTPTGELKFAVVERHFLFNRHRYREELSCDVSPDDIQSACSTAGKGQTVTFGVENNAISWFYVSQNQGIPLLLIPMIIVEYIAYCLLFKRHELL